MMGNHRLLFAEYWVEGGVGAVEGPLDPVTFLFVTCSSIGVASSTLPTPIQIGSKKLAWPLVGNSAPLLLYRLWTSELSDLVPFM